MNKATITTLVAILVLVIGGVLMFGGENQDQPSATGTTTDPSATTTQAGQDLSADLTAGTYAINTDESTVQWTAYKTLVDGYEDVGTFPVSGTVAVNDDGSISTDATLDIANLSVTSVSGPGGTNRLANHLRSEDFFAAEEYPTSTLTTTEVVGSTSSTSTYNVTADLTMKGQTNEITFPATIGMQENSLVVQADTEIDRSRWNIRYGSPSFFNDLGDNVIGDMVDISVNLVAEMNSDDTATSTEAAN